MTSLDELTGSGHWLAPALYPRPDAGDIASCLQACAPHLDGTTVEFMAEGWEFWAFSAGDYVIRSPKTATGAGVMAMDKRLLPELAQRLTVPVPFVEIFCESGPNGQPLTAHRRLEGVLLDKDRSLTGFGWQLGRLIRELHAFPVERALALDVPLYDGPALRSRRVRHYDLVRERVFPIVSAGLRRYVETRFESYLYEPSNFEFEPCLLHQDLDSNILLDPETGDITGLIDFSAALVSNPAIDFWLPLAGFAALGIEDQMPECLEAAGVTEADVLRMMPEVDFWTLRYPLFGIMHGLNIGDNGYVEESIRELEQVAARTLS